VTEQYVGVPVDDLIRDQQAEISRLQTLVEAAGRLLATLDLEQVLPQVLDLARQSLAADAYALWRRDVRTDEWALQAFADLSDEYVSAASAAISRNTAQVSLDGPIIASAIASTTWLTPEHRAAHQAEGNRAFLAMPLRHQDAVIGTLVFYYRRERTFDDDELKNAAAVASLAAAAIGTVRIYAEQETLAEDRRVLAEVSDRIAGAFDYESTLATVAQLVVQSLADLCTIYLADGDDLVRISVAHAEPELAELYATRVSSRFRADSSLTAPGVQAFLRGEPVLVPDARESLAADLQARGIPREVVDRMSLGSALAVPLIARGRPLGFMLLGSRRVHRYGEADVPFAVELARRTGLAIENVRLHESTLGRERRLRFVAEAGEVLGSSLDYAATLATVARLVVGELADWCIVDVVEGTAIRRVSVAATDPDQQRALEELRDRFPPSWDSPQPAARALREGKPVVFETFSPERLAETVYDADHLALMLRLDPHSAVAVPLIARGQTLGAITVAWSRSGRVYEEDDLKLIEDVARRAAVAVDNTRLYAAERAAGTRLRFLAEASSTLASSLDYETTLQNVAKLVVPRFADWCAIDLIDDDGAIRRLAVVHKDPAKREWALRSRDEWAPTADEREGTGRVVRTGASALYHHISDEFLAATARSEGQLEVLRALGMQSAIVVPLAARGKTLGALMLVSADRHHLYTDDDLDFVEQLGRRAATAVDNARLHRTAVESRGALETLFGTIPVGLGFWDREFRCVRLNEALAEINGVPVEESIGRRVSEYLPELAPTVEPLWQEILETGEPILETEVTGEVPAAPGVRQTWLVSYFPTRDTEGEIMGIGAVVVDISQRRRAETTLRMLAEAGRLLGSSLDDRAMLQSLVELVVPDFADSCVVHLVDDQGALERTVEAHTDERTAALHAEQHRRWPPSPTDSVGQAEVLRTGEPEVVLDVRDEHLVEASLDEDHLELLRELGISSYIAIPLTARERSLGTITFSCTGGRRFESEDVALAAALAGRAGLAVDNALLFHELEQRAQSALALAFVGDGVFLVDDDQVVRLWNTAASVITGLPAARIVGRQAAHVIPGWAAIVERAPVSTAPEVPRAETVPVELHGAERWFSISGVSFPGGVVYAFRDLTDEQRVERLKSEFVSTISHELRTPLAAIYGAALTLRRDEPALEPQREGLLDVIAVESDRLARIVNDILWASRLESGTLHVAVEHCDAAQLAQTVVGAARTHLPARIKLDLDVADDLPALAADPDKVRQVLTNLVDNAVKYSPDGGAVLVRVAASLSRVSFAVSDEGLGIPASEQSRIFDKFYRLDPELTRGIGGTGLGLYITRELARRMGGDVAVESMEGVGSTFTVELPVAR
jgi:PAS domain S-box-containing protein